jgi:hypothetical protein
MDFPPSNLKMLRDDVTGKEILKLVKEVNSKTTSLVRTQKYKEEL